MKNIICLLLFILLFGCHTIVIPENFIYQEIQTSTYKLATWQKITNKKLPIRIYIEGDGHAFDHSGYPTNDPTPCGTFLRDIVFNDLNPNVVYLARPCQYVKDKYCSQKDWTTGRFSQDIINSTAEAIQKISNDKPIILIGYSGGALLSGLVIEENPQIPVKKWITIAGVLNHTRWTKDLKLPPLIDSKELEQIPNIPQTHLVGKKDKIVSYKITQELINKKDLIIIPNATHNKGYQKYLKFIYD